MIVGNSDLYIKSTEMWYVNNFVYSLYITLNLIVIHNFHVFDTTQTKLYVTMMFIFGLVYIAVCHQLQRDDLKLHTEPLTLLKIERNQMGST